MPHKDDEAVERLIHAPRLADALESEPFRHLLDRVPFAVAVAKLRREERIAYTNPHFEKLTGARAADIEGKPWSVLQGSARGAAGPGLGAAVTTAHDFVGTFVVRRSDGTEVVVDAYSNLIEDDEGRAVFRIVALVDVTTHAQAEREALEAKVKHKDLLLRELQHRVRNNLQLITALIRMEARNYGKIPSEPFDRLSGRIEALALLYQSLGPDQQGHEVDLGAYLTQVASMAMRAYAVEGVRLDLKVDTLAVPINVAMPVGLAVNELLTNALKHAFGGRSHGTITVRSVLEGEHCRVTVADDGVGFAKGVEWLGRGKLGALILQALSDNAHATFDVESSPGKGTSVTMTFTRPAASYDGVAAEVAGAQPFASLE